MRYRRLGDSGLKVSVVGLGTNNFGRRMDAKAAANVVHAAIDSGITLFDTADVYGNGDSEEYLGRALQGQRDKVLIATKFGSEMGEGPNDKGGSRARIRAAVQASLRRLGTDYIDLYQMHWPDLETPIDETLSTLNDLVREGTVRYIGSSNFAGWQIADAEWSARTHGDERFVSAQNRYSLMSREIEQEVIPACEHFGIGVIPYFPLESGFLTGKYQRGQQAPEGTRLAGSPRAGQLLTDENFDILDRLQEFARERGLTLLDVAIGGLAAQPQVSSVIAGATRVEQVQANAAAGDWEPTAEDLTALDAIVPSLRPS